MLEVAQRELGKPAVDELLASLGTTVAACQDANAWFSLEFAEALMQALVVRAGDPFVIDRGIKLSLSPRYLGILYPLFRSFGTPAFLYRQLTRLTPRLNKVCAWTAEFSEPQKARITVRRLQGAPAETTDAFCRVRSVSLAEGATLFDLPPAEVNHPQCMRRGDDACVYDIQWKEHRRPIWSWLGLGLGAALGVGAAGWLGGPHYLTPGLTALLAAGGWAMGRSRELRRDLSNRLGDLTAVYDALARSTLAHEQRYAELLQAKTEVDLKVQARTAELRASTQQLSETLEKLQALDRAKTDFFNNVSHELRSPLTMILAPLEELVAGRPPPGGERAAFEVMHRNASRLVRLINQLLDLAKIDAGEMQIAPTPSDLTALARSTLRGFEAAAAQKRVQLTLQAPQSMADVSIDVSWIESAITNLVANALRLTAPDTAVQVRVVDDGDSVSVAVSDTGPGIAPADQQKIFERFAQGDSTRRLIGGTGIGLALVREAARLHGGDVAVVSELGHGATFTLTLPRRATAAVGGGKVSPAAPEHVVQHALGELDEVEGDVERAGPAPNAALALVVEDNPELRAFIADVLARRYRVRTARNGVQAAALAVELKPEVVVSDVAMPEMDGYELCRVLRADERTRTIPILLVTARTDVASVLQGFEVGANDYLLKPFHATELLARTDVHVRLRRLTGQLARQERLAALGSLAASVAHNVRNPLSALISGLPAMRSRLGKLDPSTDELMGIMLDCAERIERMTIDLLDLSRIDREENGEFQPGAGLLACTRMLASRLPINVVLRTDVDETSVVMGRAGDVNHVFMNILDNAIQAVGDSGVIEVSGHGVGDNYVVSIADSGNGVAAGLTDRVFEPFWTTRAAGEGTGLGLSIAKQIVEEHAGSIEVGAGPLGGAVFTVRLPLRRVGQRLAG